MWLIHELSMGLHLADVRTDRVPSTRLLEWVGTLVLGCVAKAILWACSLAMGCRRLREDSNVVGVWVADLETELRVGARWQDNLDPFTL